MSLELRPLGVNCNLGCTYCYQDPVRTATRARKGYDLTAMKATLAREGSPFTLFGGEPLLVPLEDLEDLWRWGFERYGQNSVQTNGTLITEEHIDLFRRYRVAVGISMDGPGRLNELRVSGTPEKTAEATARTEAAIARLVEVGMRPGVIVTLHRANAAPERLPELLAWLRRLDGLGIKNVRLHLLESESAVLRTRYRLSDEEYLHALTECARLQADLTSLRFDTFGDMLAMLRGEDERVTCVWRACDPFTTDAVQGVEGDGSRSNCGRTNKDGIDFLKSDVPGYERYVGLYTTPQEDGGCSGCRFFLVCKGQCPGTGIDNDWRNRSEHCAVWFGLYSLLERGMELAGETPLSRSPLRETLEQDLVEAWTDGENPSLAALLKTHAGADVSGER